MLAGANSFFVEMDANNEVLVAKMREVLGHEKERVLSVSFTGGCFREVLYRSHTQVLTSMELVSKEIRDGEEYLEWIRREKKKAQLRYERMSEMEGARERDLAETIDRMGDLKVKKEKMEGMVAQWGDYGRLEVATSCSCEEECQCIKSLGVGFLNQDGDEKQVLLDPSSMLGEWRVRNGRVGGGDGEGNPRTCGDTQGEEEKKEVGGGWCYVCWYQRWTSGRSGREWQSC